MRLGICSVVPTRTRSLRLIGWMVALLFGLSAPAAAQLSGVSITNQSFGNQFQAGTLTSFQRTSEVFTTVTSRGPARVCIIKAPTS